MEAMQERGPRGQHPAGSSGAAGGLARGSAVAGGGRDPRAREVWLQPVWAEGGHRGRLRLWPRAQWGSGTRVSQGGAPEGDLNPRAGAGGDHGASGRVVDTKHPQSRVEGVLEEYRWVWEDEGRGGLGIGLRARW